MSRVYFHFAEGEVVELLGMERGWLGMVADRVAFGAAGLTRESGRIEKDVLEDFEPFLDPAWVKQHRQGGRLVENLGLYMKHDEGNLFSWKGRRIKGWNLLLNTAIDFGSDAVALAAKIHATCEIHGNFLGQDRAWLADLIEWAVENNVYRRSYTAMRNPSAEILLMMNKDKELPPQDTELVEHSMGWTEIVAQLRKHDTGDVVMSYSVTDGFPRRPEGWIPNIPVRQPENDWETLAEIKDEMFWELSAPEKFALALAELRTPAPGRNEPIGPKNLHALGFGDGLNLMDLARHDIKKIEERLKCPKE